MVDLGELARSYQDRGMQAQKAMERIRLGRYEGVEGLHTLLRSFVLHKYLLPQDTQEESLSELATLSVARTMALYGGEGRVDHPATCEGTTSAMNKKILLLLALQRELGISFDPRETAAMGNTRDIARALFSMLGGKEEQNEENP